MRRAGNIVKLPRLHRGRWHVAVNLQWELRDWWVGLFWRYEDRWHDHFFADGRGAVVQALHVYACIVPALPIHLLVWRTS